MSLVSDIVDLLVENLVASPAYRSPSGKVYLGPYHGAIMDRVIGRPDVPSADHYWQGVEGFVTHDGRFLDRQQAMKMARKAQQLGPDAKERIASQSREWLDSDDLAEEVKLPDHVAGIFNKIADQQRGEAEDIATKLSEPSDPPEKHTMNAHGKGFRQFMSEHIGDLIHRMTERYATNSGTMGYEAVKEKVDRSLHYLRHPYGHGREAQEQLTNNHDFHVREKGHEGSLEDWKKAHAAVGERYAQAHSRIPVYNDMQFHAREAAMAYGRKDYDRCEFHLTRLDNKLVDPDVWADHASQYDPDYEKNHPVLQRRRALANGGTVEGIVDSLVGV